MVTSRLSRVLWGIVIYHTHASSLSSTPPEPTKEITSHDVTTIDLSELPLDLTELPHIEIAAHFSDAKKFDVESSSFTQWFGRTTDDDILKLFVSDETGALKGSAVISNTTYQLFPTDGSNRRDVITLRPVTIPPPSQPHIRGRLLATKDINAAKLFKLNITTDKASHETKWTLKGSDGKVIRSNSPLAPEKNTIFEEMLSPDECYMFTIHDVGDDGMCCDFSTKKNGGFVMSYDGKVELKAEGPTSFSKMAVSIGDCEMTVKSKIKVTFGSFFSKDKPSSEFEEGVDAPCEKWCDVATSVPWHRAEGSDVSQPQKCDWSETCGGCKECQAKTGIVYAANEAKQFAKTQWNHLSDFVTGNDIDENEMLEEAGSSAGNSEPKSFREKVSHWMTYKWSDVRKDMLAKKKPTIIDSWEEGKWEEMSEVSSLPCRSWCEGNEVPWRADVGVNQKCDWLISCAGCKQCDPSYSDEKSDVAYAEEMEAAKLSHDKNEMEAFGQSQPKMEQVENIIMRSEDMENHDELEESTLAEEENPASGLCKDWCNTFTDRSDENICEWFHCAGCERCI